VNLFCHCGLTMFGFHVVHVKWVPGVKWQGFEAGHHFPMCLHGVMSN
jgi:hypothetical protein